MTFDDDLNKLGIQEKKKEEKSQEEKKEVLPDSLIKEVMNIQANIDMPYFAGQLRKLEEEKQKILLKQQKKEEELKQKYEKEKEKLQEKQRKEQEKIDAKQRKEELKKLKKKDINRSLAFTDVREYLNKFSQAEKNFYLPKQSSETVDEHLDNQETVHFVNPKKYAEKEITWNEFRDIPAYWKQKEGLLYAIIFIIFLFFASIYFTYWGYVL